MIENESQEMAARLTQLETYRQQLIEMQEVVTDSDIRELLDKAHDRRWAAMFNRSWESGDEETADVLRYVVAFHRLGGGVHKFMRETFQRFPMIVEQEPAHNLVKHLAMYYKHIVGLRPDEV